MQRYEKSRFVFPLVILGSVCFLFFSLFLFNIYISDEIDELSEQNLKQLVNNSAESFKLKFELDINLLESSASLLPVWDYLRYINFDSEHYQFLARSFDYMIVVNPYGYGVGSDSNIGDVVKFEYFQKAMKGETVIDGPFSSTFNKEQAIFIATPMIAHGETRGVLTGLIYLDTLDDMFDITIQGVSANLILDSKGNIISNGVKDSNFKRSTNAFSLIENSDLKTVEEFELLKKDIANNVGGGITIDFNGERSNVIYKPIGIKDWMIMSVIPEDVVLSTTRSIVVVTAIVSIVSMLFIAVFGFMINASQRQTLAKIAEIAYVSQLTGIRTLIKFKLDSKEFISQNSDKKFLLIKFDIENFRLINESLSIKEGDRVLKSMATAISCGSNNCISAHVHADEFIVMIAYTNENVNKWRDTYEKNLLKLLGREFNYNFRIITGYYFMESKKIDISTAIERVNIAHRYAKETKSLLSIYSDEFLLNAIKTKEIENHMEEALHNKEFIMFLQPELNLKEGKLVGAEALVRWKTSNGFMRPDEFIPVFEQNGFILKLDMFMFEQACSYLHSWIEEGRKAFIISVNFSRKHLYSSDFVSNLDIICKKYNVDPKYLGIEITESSMLGNEIDLIALIHKLKSFGFNVLMDDFGSGYSSLGLLKNMPIDVLKLDKSFFTEIESHERSIAVVKSVIDLSKNLEIKTIAEGVETLDNAKILKQMGCDILQGYYYAKPMCQEDFRAFYDDEASNLII